MLYRHGDVLIAAVDTMPDDVRPQPNVILAHGEITGHTHRVKEPGAAELFQGMDGLLFLKVIAPEATVIHEEHAPITLPQGIYRVWQQREYTPQEIRRVID